MTTLQQPFDQTQDSRAAHRSTQHEEISEADEALHRRALEQLQLGEWNAAIDCLSGLTERYPDHEYYTDLLQQARLRARLDENPPQRRTGHSLLRSRAVWVLAALSLVLWAAIFGRQLYRQQVVPALQERRVAARQQQLLEEGRQFLVDGELDLAEDRFNKVLALNPDSTTARRTLQEINQRQQLAQTYETAMSLIEQEEWESALAALDAIRQEAPGFRDVQQQVDRVHALRRQQQLGQAYDAAMTYIEQEEWESALAALEAIREKDPGFRDVQPQIDRVRKLRKRASAFQEANRLFQSGDWQRAVDQLVLLAQEAPDYKPEAVKELLFESYMKQAEAALSGLGQDPTREIEQLQGAIGFFTKALAVDPSDADADTQTELAQEYLAGLEAYGRGDRESASVHLTDVYNRAPDYANGRVAALLQEISELSSPATTTYIVQAGDTLSQIAKRFGTTVAALMEANEIIKNKNFIRTGWELIISPSQDAIEEEQ